MVTCPYDSCVPWEPNMGCCSDWDTLHIDLRNRSVSLAWAAMRFLTGGVVGSCLVTLRPCESRSCSVCHANWYMRYPDVDVLVDGYRCGDGSCSCTRVSEVVLPGLVADVSEVFLFGKVLPASSYRLDNGNRLIRIDGDVWPHCQDMSTPDSSDDAFTVSYVPGMKPDSAGLWAVGVLACEFAKACSGEKCRLPSSVSSLSRQGVSYQFDNSMFSNGQTGIREVDAYVLSVNPNRLKVPPKVWSPDSRRGRYTSPVPMVPVDE